MSVELWDCKHIKNAIANDLDMPVKEGVVMHCFDSGGSDCEKALADGLCHTQPKSLLGKCKVG